MANKDVYISGDEAHYTHDSGMRTTMRRSDCRLHWRLLQQNDVPDAVRELCSCRSPGTIFVDSLDVDVLRRGRGTGC